VDGDYAVLHPGAKDPSRCWPPDDFAAAGDALAADGLRIALTGQAAEAGLVARVRSAMRAPALDLAGRTPLGVLAALLADARVVVANDTGTMHLACAVGAPSVAVLLAPSSATWAPLDAERHPGLWADAAGTVPVDRVVAEARRVGGQAFPVVAGAARVSRRRGR
jgi:ADP-heptose:LPS heptosyltransferase